MIIRRWLGISAAVVLLSALGVSAASAGPEVSPVPSTLPVGGAPRLPYVDVAAKKIVDGSRRISIAGLAGTVTHLLKVDGGYVVGRNSGAAAWRDVKPGLAFITTSGGRSSITGNWFWPRDETIFSGVRVSARGDKIVFNTAQVDDQHTYRDTVIMEVPSGRILHRRTFSVRPDLLGFDGNRVFLGVGVRNSEGQIFAVRALWWTPGTHATEVLESQNHGTMSADMSARQYVSYRAPDGGGEVELWVAPIRPRVGATWDAGFESQYGVWSLDDLMVAGTGAMTLGEDYTESFSVHTASDGAHRLSVIVEGVPQITWESNSSLLIMTGTAQDGFRLIRCSLTGVCQRVGPLSPTKYGPYVIADRRNS